MPALPLWGVIVVVLSVASIIIGLLFCLFRCRRFPRSTVDPAEYSTKKQGFPTNTSEAISHSTQEKTICPTTTTTTTSHTQSFTPTTTLSSPSSPSSSSCSILPSPAHAYSGEPLSEKHHEYEKAAPTNHQEKDLQISLPLPPPSTSFFADKMELNSDEATRMFQMYMSSDPPKSDFVSIDLTSADKPAFYDTITNLQQKASSTIRGTLRQSLRRQKSSTKKANVQHMFEPAVKELPSEPPSPPTSKENDSSDASIHQESVPLSSSPFQQLDEEADHQNSSNRTSLTSPRVSAEVSFGTESTIKGRQLFDYNLDTMFSWPSGDEEDDNEQAPEPPSDTVSIGSVHRLVRDSTVVDSDHRSLAARSVSNSVRPSLHEMASWWSNDNESIDVPVSPLDTDKSSSISKAMAYSSSSPTSTFSRATLNKFRAALADGVESDSDQENDIPDLPFEPQEQESSVKYAVPDDELTPMTMPTFTEEKEPSPVPSPTPSPTASTPSPSPPSSPTAYDNDSIQPASIKSRPVSINYQPATIRSNARNSLLTTGTNNVDSVRRVLQGTWNTHRYSDHGSIASSTRSNVSQGMSPPGSVNPRQLNQHLASLSLQSNGRLRPGLPTGFMNEDLLVPGGVMGPQPTVSFSSSTVRTMIPEDEPIERHIGQKKAAPQQQQQKQKPLKKKEPRPVVKDQKQPPTMRTGRQQRGTMPWNAEASIKPKANDKTPAQRERDRYLKSLKG